MKKMMLIAATAAGLMVMGAASAATKTTTFDVTATVANACIIDSASALAFGSYVPGDGLKDSTSNIVVRCASGRTFNIGLDQGTSTNRTMSSASVASTLAYQLYRDNARSQVWGTTVGTDTVSGTGAGLAAGNTITVPVYGRIVDSVANQAALDATDYKDTITVTLTY